MKYILKHKDVDVALLDIDKENYSFVNLADIFNHDHFPVGVQETKGSLEKWWMERGIPFSRVGVSTLLKDLSADNVDELKIKSYGLSLSDQYWVCPQGENKKWNDINFFTNIFSGDIGELLFNRETVESPLHSFLSPDSNTDGMLPKRWIIEDDKRYLVKGSSRSFYDESYIEVFGKWVADILDVPSVEYELFIKKKYPYSKCECFISKDTELVFALNVDKTIKQRNEKSDYDHYIECLSMLGVPFDVTDLDKMITLDYIISNPDRHYHNFGVIRDANTLQYISLAPIYDNGNALWANQPIGIIKNYNEEIRNLNFRKTQDRNIELVKDFSFFHSASYADLLDMLLELYAKNEHGNTERSLAIAERVKANIRYIDIVAANKSRGYNQPTSILGKAKKISDERSMKNIRKKTDRER